MLLITGVANANAQLLKKISTKVKQTATNVENTLDNKVQERTARAASDKADKVMNGIFDGGKKKKKRAGENNEPEVRPQAIAVADSAHSTVN